MDKMDKKVPIATRRTTCRYCDGADLACFLGLGDQPPSNSFLSPDEISSEVRYPLDVYLCESCGLVQLLDIVPAEVIFDDYAYLSSSSKALRAHYRSLTQALQDRFSPRDSVVVDVGCNDGIMLNAYSQPQLQRVGVEPSNAAEVALEAGLDVYRGFFTPDLAEQICRERGPAQIVTCTNVFAHVDDISSFTTGLERLLSDSGVLVIEAPYLVDLVEKRLFDTIYHEHLCYLSLAPMKSFFVRHGLEIFDVERIPFGASGPAIRVFVQKQGGVHRQERRVESLLDFEASWGASSLQRFEHYAEELAAIKQEARELIGSLRESGHDVGGYGAPAKGNTLLNYFELTAEDITCVADTNPRKQGKLCPGSHIPIVSEDEFLEWMPAYALLLTWNYLEFFLDHSEYVNQGGQFIVPLPELTIASKERPVVAHE